MADVARCEDECDSPALSNKQGNTNSIKGILRKEKDGSWESSLSQVGEAFKKKKKYNQKLENLSPDYEEEEPGQNRES